MNLNETLTFIFQLFFSLLGVIAIVDYVRYRGATRRDIALLFGAIGLIFWIELFHQATGQEIPWLTKLGAVALITHSYMLLRLVRYFRPVPVWIMRAAGACMLLSIIATLVVEPAGEDPPPELLAMALAMFGYFVIADAYAMIAFVRGALNSYGVIRNRLRFAAAGSGLFSGALAVAIIAVFLPSVASVLAFVALSAILGSAVCFYLGFVPPRWLRRAWQLEELRRFIAYYGGKTISEHLNLSESVAELCHSINRALGGMATAVVQWNDANQQWSVRALEGPDNFTLSWSGGGGIVVQVARERSSKAICISDVLDPVDRQLLTAVDANTLLVAPIATTQRNWGCVLVFLHHRPLFVDDDLDVLTLLAQQSALFLENSTLLEELRRYSEELEHRVEERSLQLQETRADYQRIVEAAQEGIWTTDQDNLTTFVNARMAAMLDYTVEEMQGRSFLSFVDESRQSLAEARRNAEQTSGGGEKFELTFRRKDGTGLHALVSTTPLVNDQGQLIGTLAMVTDITARKEAEEEILMLNAELEQRVAERTADLTAVNRELEAFSYSVSHDLRSPLRAMNGFSQALLEDYGDKLDEQGKNYLMRIQSSSREMGLLIDALLALGRVTRGELTIEEVDLSDMAQQIGNELASQYRDRQVNFSVQSPMIARGDRRLLEIVLSNLLSNAWKFTGNQPLADIQVGVTQHNGKQAFYVRDNGVGFDMAYANKLFGVFQRLHSTREFEGTGVGLATVERIIRRHGGEIWAEAAVNQGATFYFCL